MKEINPIRKLTRAEIDKALETLPVSHILGKTATRELTPKQKRFALEVAKGSTGAEAYRKAYKTKGKSLTQANEASRLKARPDIAAEIKAYEVALTSQEYRTPEALRALVVQTLASILVDPDAKQAVKVQAAKTIGTMTDVSLFTHRTETKVIRSSEDARTELMAQIRELTKAQAVDAEVIEHDAESLLAELEGHRTPTPQDGEQESRMDMHTIPPEQIQSSAFSENSQNDDPSPLTQEDPPMEDPEGDDGEWLLKK